MATSISINNNTINNGLRQKFKNDLNGFHEILENMLMSFEQCLNIKTDKNPQYMDNVIISLLQQAITNDSARGELVLSAHQKLIELDQEWKRLNVI